MATFWDWTYEKIAGTGSSKNRNVEICRKELAASCSHRERRINLEPPTPLATPFNEAPSQQNASIPKRKPSTMQIGGARTLTEFAHNPNVSKAPSIHYREDDILERSQRIREKSRASNKKKGKAVALMIEPLENYTANDFGTNFVVDDLDIKKAALKTLSACNVRDRLRVHAPKTEELHCIRVKAWEKHIFGADNAQSSPASDNGVTITEDGCIIQHGFEWTSADSSLSSSIKEERQDKRKQRADSGCETEMRDILKLKDTDNKIPNSSFEDAEVPDVPSQFLRRKISRARTASILSTAFGNVKSTKSCPAQFPSQGGRYQAVISEQRRPFDSIFFSNSASSNAVASSSEGSSLITSQTLIEDKPSNEITKTVKQKAMQQVVAEPTPPPSNISTSPVLALQLKSEVQEQQWIDTPRPTPSRTRSQAPNKISVQQRVPDLNRIQAWQKRVAQRTRKRTAVTRTGQKSTAISELHQPTNSDAQQTQSTTIARTLHAKQAPFSMDISPSMAMYKRYALTLEHIPLPTCQHLNNPFTISTLLSNSERKPERLRTSGLNWNHVAPVYGYSESESFAVIAI